MRKAQRQRGQSLVEFAFVLPIFLLILMILLDFGRVVYAQNAINNDAREGARVGSVSTQDLAAPTDWTARFAAIRDAARTMSPGVELADSAITGKPGACPVTQDPLTGTCFYPSGITDPSSTIYVQITVEVPLLTPIIGQLLGDSFTMTATSETLVQ